MNAPSQAHVADIVRLTPALVDFQRNICQYGAAWGLDHLARRLTDEERFNVVKQYAPIWVLKKDENSGKFMWDVQFGSLVDEPELKQALEVYLPNA